MKLCAKVSWIPSTIMKGLTTIILVLTLATVIDGGMIGYLTGHLRAQEPLKPDFEPAEPVEPVESAEPGPEKPVESAKPRLEEPNVMSRLYYTKLIQLLLSPITRTTRKNRFTSFGGSDRFGLRFWKTSV